MCIAQQYNTQYRLLWSEVKNLPAVQETQVDPWEHPLQKGIATHSSILAWRIPWMEEPGGLQSVDHKESKTAE